MFAHPRAATMPATRTVALPDSVRTNARNGADRSRAQVVRCRHLPAPARESGRAGRAVAADSRPGPRGAPWAAEVSSMPTRPYLRTRRLRDSGGRPMRHHLSGRLAGPHADWALALCGGPEPQPNDHLSSG